MIANILTANKKFDTLDFINKIYNKDEINPNIPTLIIGYKNAKDYCGDNFNILKKQISDNVYWTFSKTEKRIEYDNDLEEFYRLVFKTIVKNIKYTFFNIFTFSLTKKKSLINFINSKKTKYVYIVDDFIYILHGNKVVGLSLYDIEYLGIEREKILSRLKDNKSNIFIENTKFLSYKIKKYIGDNNILIPYLYSLYCVE